jgi:hypothetical protein
VKIKEERNVLFCPLESVGKKGEGSKPAKGIVAGQQWRLMRSSAGGGRGKNEMPLAM